MSKNYANLELNSPASLEGFGVGFKSLSDEKNKFKMMMGRVGE
jgi:hypothetical protein